MNITLAAMQTQSDAYRVGYCLGMVIGVLILLGSLALLVVSIVMLARGRRKAWLAGLVPGAILVLLFAGGIVYGLVRGFRQGFASTRPSPGVVSPAGPTRVTASDGRISLQVPGYWLTMPLAKPEITFQAGSEPRNEFVQVLTDLKIDLEMDLAEYSDTTSNSMVVNLQSGAAGPPSSCKVAGHPALQREITGTVDAVRICYLQTVIETDDAYYQIVMWTTPSKKQAAFAVFRNVLQTVQTHTPEEPDQD